MMEEYEAEAHTGMDICNIAKDLGDKLLIEAVV